MDDDAPDAVTALYRLAAAQVELEDALHRLTATCQATAAAMRGTSLGPRELHPDLAAHPDLADVDGMLTTYYG